MSQERIKTTEYEVFNFPLIKDNKKKTFKIRFSKAECFRYPESLKENPEVDMTVFFI